MIMKSFDEADSAMNLPSTGTMEPNFLGELGPDSALPVPAQKQETPPCPTSLSPEGIEFCVTSHESN
jgi:hypothetical protein